MRGTKAVLALAMIGALYASVQPRVWAQTAPAGTTKSPEKVYSYAPDPDGLFGSNPAPLGQGRTFRNKKLFINGTGPSDDAVTRADPHSGLESNVKIYDRKTQQIYDYPNDLPGVTATREMRQAGARPGDMAKVCADVGGATNCALGPIYDTYNGSNNHAEITPQLARNLNVPLTATSSGYVPTQDMSVNVTVYPGTNQSFGFYPDSKTFVYMTPPQTQIDYYNQTLPPPGQ